MSALRQRLLDLLEFAKETAAMRSSPVSELGKNKDFVEYEHRIAGLPGVHLNVETEIDSAWLRVDRLKDSAAALPTSVLLNVWMDPSNSPTKEPTLKSHVTKADLEKAGLASQPELLLPPDADDPDPSDELVALPDFDQVSEVRALFGAYLNTIWLPWAALEKRRRQTIKLYSNIYTLKQQLEGDIVDSPIELVWGMGVVLWQHPNGTISYPLTTQLVEIDLDEQTMSLSIRPSSASPNLELQIFDGMDNAGLADIANKSKSFWAELETSWSPFDRNTFEPLLQLAAGYLDAHGIYWPNEAGADDRTLPKLTSNPCITDTWTLFARPRGKNSFIQDLERFASKVKDNLELVFPDALASILRDPDSIHTERGLPNFRGLSMVGGTSDGGSAKVQDLFFPLPFNDEQVRIVQLLEAHDGVAVQGPPGTGKTHTIANIACHYLAQGKRVLITSMKEPALAVLKEKMPEQLQPLTVSMLSSDKDGLRQFEQSITRIAAELSSIDRVAYGREIQALEDSLDTVHAAMAKVDREVQQWGLANLASIDLDGMTISPSDAAKEVSKGLANSDWIPDLLSVDQTFSAKMKDRDMGALRQARLELGADIAYLGCKLPLVSEFPPARDLIRVHSDLVRYSILQKEIDAGDVLSLNGNSLAVYEEAQGAAAQLSNLGLLRNRVTQINQSWVESLRSSHADESKADVMAVFHQLRDELTSELSKRSQFIATPVGLPIELETQPELVVAIENLAQGKKPFGLLGALTHSAQKKLLDTVTVTGIAASNSEDWQHVRNYIAHRASLKQLMVRWNALAPELGLEILEAKPESAVQCVRVFETYQAILDSAALQSSLIGRLKLLFPEWKGTNIFTANDEERLRLEDMILHHLNHHRLSETWAVRQQCQDALTGKSGAITDQIRTFFSDAFGTEGIHEAEIQNQWTALTQELDRVHGLRSPLQVVQGVTHLIEASGAPILSKRLSTEPALTSGTDIPDNWDECWRLKRLKTHLDSIDARHTLRRLANERKDLEKRLSNLYQEIVSKRTWLKLAQSATPEVRSALAAFSSAIKSIGKGTGKRAARFQQEARRASDRANQAIPCWIMPHHRVSESMPADFGYFDLVIIDEASQSDLSALPALLRAKKILVVGDEKQVSPEGVGLEEEKIKQLMQRYLINQVDIYRGQMTPDRSMYDLFKVVYQQAIVTLKEHFRCVPAIIEYSKREFYGHDIRPLRLPKQSERIDPPLMDVFVEDGVRNHEVNKAEALFILSEIKKIVEDPSMSNRTIGVVSLTGEKQALHIWDQIERTLSFDLIARHKIACGDARTFQGKERDIMFLSMVVAPGDAHAVSGRGFDQRFNVAASRARDRMYLVRSVMPDDLSPRDNLRRGLISHFENPFGQDEQRVKDLRELCESPFELEVYDLLTERGYRVIPQVPVDRYRIDMVVEGENDRRLAIECDGDQYHGPDKWDDDMRRQRVLERAGWQFWRCFASTFVMSRDSVIEDLLTTLSEKGIEPIGSADSATHSIHCGAQTFSMTDCLDKETPLDTVELAL